MVERSCDINPFEDGTALGELPHLPSFDEALSRLVHLAEHGRPCGIVRGPAGCGKSPLLQSVTQELRRAGQQCGSLDLRRSSTDEFAAQIAGELGTLSTQANRHTGWRLVEDTIQGRALAGRPTLLVLDHLGEHTTDLLAQLKRLLAIAEASAGWCTVLGAARSEVSFIDHFVREHSELRIELGQLTLAETGEFLHRVVATTGCCPFDDDAVQTLHDQSQGVLKSLLTLGRLAILAQSAEGVPLVTGEIARLVAAEVSPQPLSREWDDQSALIATVD